MLLAAVLIVALAGGAYADCRVTGNSAQSQGAPCCPGKTRTTGSDCCGHHRCAPAAQDEAAGLPAAFSAFAQLEPLFVAPAVAPALGTLQAYAPRPSRDEAPPPLDLFKQIHVFLI